MRRCVDNIVSIDVRSTSLSEFLLPWSLESDIIHLSALGNSIIVLNSAGAVNDLLEKRSVIYSSRPESVMLGELMG